MPTSLMAIQELTPQAGVVAGFAGLRTDVNRPFVMAKTVDGGQSWHAFPVPLTQITTLRFIDEQLGWASGFEWPSYVVVRTTDGGATWRVVLSSPSQTSSPPEVAPELQVVDAVRAWALIPQSACSNTQCPTELRRTTDGGQTWTTVATGDIALIRFASATRGWMAIGNIGNSAQVRMTSDGGTTWSAGFSTTTGLPVGLDAATVNIAWFLTSNGGYCTSSNCSNYTLFRTTDGGLNWANLGNPKAFATSCSGGHLIGPLFASPLRGWFGLSLGAGGANVGPGGILRSEDGGLSWTCTTTPPNVNQVSAADPLHVWASDAAGSALYASEDGGHTWRQLPLQSGG
jgi:photosystem II stability/assembly factor-like uncharacterized protein